MLHQSPFTIPAEIRDFTEWRRGREIYAVWVLHIEEQNLMEKFKAAKKHLNGYLLESYNRQPHITLFVCGFLVEKPHYNDDFTQAQLQAQIQELSNSNILPFEIEVGGLNSFASAPYLEVHDPENGIVRLREILLRGGREFRTAPYTPHLTVGLYGGTFPSDKVSAQLAAFPKNPMKWKIERITLATYSAQEIAGPLTSLHEVSIE